jgi:choline monooxygenase
VEEACVPPPSWYTDPRFMALEEEKVFKRNWQYAGPVSKLKCVRSLALAAGAAF